MRLGTEGARRSHRGVPPSCPAPVRPGRGRIGISSAEGNVPTPVLRYGPFGFRSRPRRVGMWAYRTMGDTNTGRIVKAVVPVLVMAIATFMILDQLRIATNIVTITYAALIGAIALGTALAFGLGGREVAAQILDSAYERGQQVSIRRQGPAPAG